MGTGMRRNERRLATAALLKMPAPGAAGRIQLGPAMGAPGHLAAAVRPAVLGDPAPAGHGPAHGVLSLVGLAPTPRLGASPQTPGPPDGAALPLRAARLERGGLPAQSAR